MQQLQLHDVWEKLRPRDESIELGHYKKALQDVEKVLKKNPTIQCGRALKAWAFLRLGRDEESAALIKALEQETPTESTTLHVMTLCYKETDQLDKICQIFTSASKQLPGNEELLSQLFIAHMRVNDFKAQQTVAMQLYKLKPRNPFYFWAVTSVMLQALRGPDAKDQQKSSLLLSLAQRMVDKLIADNKIEASQEVQLYLQILQHQEKYQEMLTFLDGPVCTNLYPGAPHSIKIDLLKKLNKWADLNKLMKQLLTEDPDRWDYYQDYILSTIEMIKCKDETPETDHTVDMCHEFIAGIIESQPRKNRGPYLARLELARLMVKHKFDKEQQFGELTELLLDYFRMFGDKTCCANDLKLFLEYVEPAKRPGFAAQLMQECRINPVTLPSSKEHMQRHICSLQIARFCGAHAALSEEHLSALYTALSLHYEHGYNTFGQGLLPTDMGPSDPYALLAVNIMYDRAWKLQRSEPLVEALCLLNHLLSNSINNFHGKLLNLQLYHRLGLVEAAHRAYESLDIKHIQLDSLGYLHCSHLCNGGFPALAKQIFDQTLHFFINDTNSVEFLKTSYNFGSFSKLIEFLDFRDRLSNSLHFTLISVEALLLEMVCFSGTLAQNLAAYRLMRIKPQEDRIKWDEMSDNRDLTIFVHWDPTVEQLREECQKDSFSQEHELLQLRSGLLRLVSSFIELFTKGGDDEYQTAQDLSRHWEELFVTVRAKNRQPACERFLVNLLPSRLHSVLAMPYEAVFRDLASFLLALWKGEKHDQIRSGAERCVKHVNDLFELIAGSIKTYNSSGDLLWNRKKVHDTVNACVEIAALVLFVMTVCFDKYSQAPAPQPTRKTKKKDSEQNNHEPAVVLMTEKNRLQLVVDVLRALKTNLVDCEAVLSSWELPLLSDSLAGALEQMSLGAKSESAVRLKLMDTHLGEIKELKKLLKDKLKLINKSI
uniref:Phagocyte signaling-impaired protein n=1 Tax=Aedes aegypti TaxID=7159 RepID=NAA25_AEDAE|nr:RecName: Full=Phagocyte signaling-impaired protein; AltName: Full=N-terminal acetyltransferase B complex subunit MDM20 homolog; AltName: Full=N-terminal acetyltransferase B complex subunit NAA25 homolog [Aedes aegypti]